MTCENFKALLAAEIYGDNQPEDRQALASHVASCADCRNLEAEWRRALKLVPAPALPADESFWIRQKAAIMGKLPARKHSWMMWSRLAGPVVAMGLLVSVWSWHRENEKTALGIAQNMDLLQNMDMLQNLEIVQDLDVVEGK